MCPSVTVPRLEIVVHLRTQLETIAPPPGSQYCLQCASHDMGSSSQTKYFLHALHR